MKKFLSVVLTVFMLAQILFIPAAAQDDAQVRFNLGDVTCNPGEKIYIPLTVESVVNVNSIAIRDLNYDKNVLTFVGFANPGEVAQKNLFGVDSTLNDEKGTVIVGLLKEEMLSGKICDVVFEVKETVSAGTTTYVGATGIGKLNADVLYTTVYSACVSVDGNNETEAPEPIVPPVEPVETDPVETEPVPTEAEVVYTFGDVTCNPGETISVPLTVKSFVNTNSIAIRDIVYDKNVLTFVGFANPGDVAQKNFAGVDNTMNSDKGVVIVGLMAAELVSGKLCDVVFEVNSNVSAGTKTTIGATGIAKLNAEVLTVGVNSGVVYVEGALETEPVETEPVPTEAEVVYTFGDVTCNPGETISVPLTVKSFVNTNSIAIRDIVYDKNILTFVGFDNPGDVAQKNFTGVDNTMNDDKGVVIVGLMAAELVSGKLCDVVFEVNSNVSAGTKTTIGATGIAKLNAEVLTVNVETATVTVKGAPETEAPETTPVEPVEEMVIYSIGNVTCKPGSTIKIPLSVTSGVDVNSLALANVNYDASVLTFAGFTNPGEVVEKSLFGANGLDNNRGTVSIGLMKAERISGRICDLVFTVNADIPEGTRTFVSFGSVIAKNNSTIIDTMLIHGEITISSQAETEKPEIEVPETKPVDPEVPETEPSGVEVVYTLGDAVCRPGSTIRIPLSVESYVEVNSLAVGTPYYDSKVLTFVGFENPGEVAEKHFAGAENAIDNQKKTVVVGMMKSEMASGRICDLVFVVNENAPEGATSVVTFGTIVAKNGSTACKFSLDPAEIVISSQAETEAPESEAPETVPAETEAPGDNPSDAQVFFTFHDVMCNPGEEIAVEITMDSLVNANSIALYDLSYDKNILEFIGFGDYGNLIDENIFGEAGIDWSKNNIALGYMKSTLLSGKICSLLFRVKNNVPYCTTEVKMSAVVKNNSDDIVPAVDSASVAVGHVDFAFGEAYYYVEDGTICVPLNVNSNNIYIDSVTLSAPVFDETLLTFVGFTRSSELVIDSEFGREGLDAETQTIVLSYNNSRPLHGRICDLVFKINENGAWGVTEIGMSSVVKNDNDEIYSAVQPGTAAVGEVHLGLGSVMCVPGDTISFDVTVEKATVPVDTLKVSDFVYDESLLTFVGINYNGDVISKEYLEIAFDEPTYPEGVICSLIFKVNESASGLAEVKAFAEGINSGLSYPTCFITNGTAAIGKAELSFSTVECAPGEKIAVELVIDSTMPVDTIVIDNVGFDKAAFVLERVEWEIGKYMGSFRYNHEYDRIEIFLNETQVLTGLMATLHFTVAEGAEDGEYAVSMSGLSAKCADYDYIVNGTDGMIEVRGEMLGDLNGDKEVNINDSLLLFRHIMLPSLYVIDYSGTIDYVADGTINLQDALYLFRHTMVPSLYPIGW